MRTGVENGVGTAHGIRAGPLTSRGLGNAKLRSEGAMTDPLLEDLAGSHHHTYSYDVKLAVVKDRLENGLTVREAMIKHKLPSESSVKAW